jgi:nicotinamide-nucleotide amidase
MTALSFLLDEIAHHLKKSNWLLVTAESCTGGLIASAITEISGSSDWFERGFVTYSNLSKEQMLGVSHELITEFGAVSEEVADAMALGALHNSAGQISVAVTGIAGPSGGSKEKPVGTVCFSWAVQGSKPQSLKKHFSGTRQGIRQAAVQQALEGILLLIKV